MYILQYYIYICSIYIYIYSYILQYTYIYYIYKYRAPASARVLHIYYCTYIPPRMCPHTPTMPRCKSA